MKKEDIIVLAQLLSGMKDAIERLETSYKKKDMEGLASAKREILEMQNKINSLL